MSDSGITLRLSGFGGGSGGGSGDVTGPASSTDNTLVRFNGATGKLEQPSVLPDSAEAIAWNVEFQTVPPQTAGGEAIQGPEARARIEAAAQRQYIAELEKVKESGGAARYDFEDL